jgi:hypothetical protein
MIAREAHMNSTEYANWARRAFCYCEAALAEEIATPSQLCITEELVRAAFVRGLGHTKPAEAHRLRTEEPTGFAGAVCWNDPSHGASSGRPVQHDVAVAAGNDASGNADAGMITEVKWLKTNKADDVGRDLWKLAFARGASVHSAAPRAFLLIGGEASSFSSCLRSLRAGGADLRWSDAGRQGGAPSPTTIKVDAFWKTAFGRRAFDGLLGWGANGHVRQPPDCALRVRMTRRAHWLRTLPNETGNGSTSWRLVLWEMTTHGAGNPRPVPWPTMRPQAGLTC